MSGAITPVAITALMGCTWKTLPFIMHYTTLKRVLLKQMMCGIWTPYHIF